MGMEAEKITHDKINKDMIYKNAVLKIYDIPILIFLNFFIQIQLLIVEQDF